MKFQDFICGLMAGWSQIIVGQPFDYVKVKVQVQAESTKKSLIKIAQEIHNEHGFFGFYRGASSLFFGFGLTIGLEFAIYEFSKRIIYDLRNKNNTLQKSYNDGSLSITDVGLAGGIVGLCVSIIYGPMEYVKIKKQINSEVSKSSISLLFNQIKNNGIKNIFRGLQATILRQTIGTFFYYGAYEYMVRKLSNQQREQAKTMDYVMSGSVAGVSYWAISYPFDVIKTKVQNGQNYRNAFKQLLKNSYRGFSAVLIRSVLVNGVSFATYEHSKRFIEFIANKKSQF